MAIGGPSVPEGTGVAGGTTETGVVEEPGPIGAADAVLPPAEGDTDVDDAGAGSGFVSFAAVLAAVTAVALAAVPAPDAALNFPGSTGVVAGGLDSATIAVETGGVGGIGAGCSAAGGAWVKAGVDVDDEGVGIAACVATGIWTGTGTGPGVGVGVGVGVDPRFASATLAVTTGDGSATEDVGAGDTPSCAVAAPMVGSVRLVGSMRDAGGLGSSATIGETETTTDGGKAGIAASIAGFGGT